MRQAYLCSQPKLEKGRGPGCCCGHGTVPSPSYLCSQPKLEKGRGPGCCWDHSTVLWPPLYRCSQPKLKKLGAGLLRPQRCTVAAVVPLLPAKATEGAGDLLPLLPQRCTVAAAVVSHERFRTITMTTAVLWRKPRDTRRVHLRFVPGSSVSLAPDSEARPP